MRQNFYIYFLGRGKRNDYEDYYTGYDYSYPEGYDDQYIGTKAKQPKYNWYNEEFPDDGITYSCGYSPIKHEYPKLELAQRIVGGKPAVPG